MPLNRLDDWKVQVACPTCLARPRVWCKTSTGKDASTPHLNRIKRATIKKLADASGRENNNGTEA